MRISWILFVCPLFTTYPLPSEAAEDEASAACINNVDRSLNEYFEIYRESRSLKFSIFKEVPKDVLIVNESIDYIVPIVATVYFLPTAKSRGIAVLKASYHVPSPCRVQNSDGEWWVALRGRDGALSYISRSELRRAEKNR